MLSTCPSTACRSPAPSERKTVSPAVATPTPSAVTADRVRRASSPRNDSFRRWRACPTGAG
ncbi:hypothetical protein V3W47_18625 [Deinococcus sp. YIM 134068]|uniref:hypothetical protein n=1 Tax=Deinococcus lichenicola TaxID=3118910 RepID=UPI002F95EF3A